MLHEVPPTGLQLLRSERVLLTLWIKGLEHLEKWSKAVAPSGVPPEELYDHLKGSVPPIGPTPSTAGTFGRKFRKNSGKDPGKALGAFAGIPLESTAGLPKALYFKPFGASRAFPELSPPQCGWGRLFFQKWFGKPLRAGHGIPGSTEGISDWVRPDVCFSFNVAHAQKEPVNSFRQVLIGRLSLPSKTMEKVRPWQPHPFH